jgi:hypothetical protein
LVVGVLKLDGVDDRIKSTSLVTALADLPTGAYTMAWLIKFEALSGFHGLGYLLSGSGDGVVEAGLSRLSNGALAMDGSGLGSSFTGLEPTAGEEHIYVLRKASGTTLPAASRYVRSTNTWTHGNGGTNVANQIAATMLELGAWQNGDFLDGWLGLFGAWAGQMSTSDAEALSTNWRTTDWRDHSFGDPVCLIELDTTTPDDLMDGAASLSVTGATVDSGETMDDFTFDGSGPPPVIPDVESSAAYNAGTTAATSHAVPLPATVSPGSLLMMVGRVAVAGTVSITGWTVVQDSSDGSDDVTFYAYKSSLAVGNEDGTTVTVNHGNGKMSAVTLSITDAEDPATLAPEASTVATGTSTTPNPTTCTPSGGSKKYLWLWAGAWEGEQTSPPTTPPANYTAVAGADSGTGGAVTTNTRTYVAKRQNEATSEDPGSVTISVSDDWTAWTLAISPPGTGQDIDVAQAVETDTATAVGRKKSKALALATEADTATAVGRRKAEPAAQAVSTEVAFAVGRRKSVLVGQAVETDTAGTVHPPAAQNIDVGQAVEADTATSITRRKAEAVAQAQETDTATTIARRKAEAAAQAVETDSATTIARRKAKAAAQAQETDSATAITRRKAEAVTVALETNSATVVARRKARGVAQAQEVETAQPVARRKARTAGQALEADTALAVGTTGNKNITVTQALETDTGSTITRRKSKAITIAQTTDTATAITRRKARAVTQAGDTSTSFSVATRKHKLVSEAQSTDLAFALTGAKRKALVIAAETDTAGEITVQGTSVPTGLRNVRARVAVRGASSKIRAVGPAATVKEV